MLKHCLIAFCMLFQMLSIAQSINNGKTDSLPEILVKSAWAKENTPLTFTNFKKEDLEKKDFGQDLPYILQHTTSVVVSSDAGNGVGYTGFRIRGSDPTRVNVTINGIPYNDPESHSVYWVDLPDIFSSTQNIQIQRGVGSSANGAGAFGSSINLNTNTLQLNPSTQLKLNGGSFGTKRLTFQANTGLKKGFALDVKISKINSNGYINRAKSSLFSYNTGLSWLGKKSSLRFNFIDGFEQTYQSWYGLPVQLLNTDRTYNEAGMERSGNPYENQIDKYRQTHYQLFWNYALNHNQHLNIALYATKGKGYYEEYKASKTLANYGFESKDTSDLVQRRWLDNWLIGLVFGYNFTKNKVDLTIGGGANRYDGNHFGEVIWTKTNTENTKKPLNFYSNNGLKYDANIYAKMNYLLNAQLNLYADLQYRQINYFFVGKKKDGSDINQDDKLSFFNPKAGIGYVINSKLKSYMSFGIAQREPNRDDYVQSTAESRPKSEQLQNLELGLKFKQKNTFANVNFYLMYYKNQLVLTGQINDIGAYNRQNVAKSYRAGIELEAGAKWNKISVSGNITLSENKILNYTNYLDNWDLGTQEAVFYKKTDIAFSPNQIASFEIDYNVYKNLHFTFLSKYVGKQYLDNSMSEVASLKAFSSSDVRVYYLWNVVKKQKIEFSFQVNNIFNHKYANNGWTYQFISNGYNPVPFDKYVISDANTYRQIGLFPQAEINFNAGVSYKF